MDRFGLYGAPLNVAADTSCWKRKSVLCMCALVCTDRPDISVMDPGTNNYYEIDNLGRCRLNPHLLLFSIEQEKSDIIQR